MLTGPGALSPFAILAPPRVLLVLLHDFPEFLSDYHVAFCDVIPISCIQLRNLVLSAFPRNMRLPDPFTPNLKVDLLPEISQSPRILNTYTKALVAGNFLCVLVRCAPLPPRLCPDQAPSR